MARRAETPVAVFAGELRLSSFPDRFLTMPAQRHSQPTPTSLGQGCVRI